MGQEPENTPQEGQEPTPAPEEPKATAPTGFDALPAETQQEIKQLRAEAAKHRKEAQEAKAKAEEFEDRDKSELEKLTGKLSKAEQAKAEAETTLLRFQVAAEKQVPSDALDLLVGNTREELEAKADKLLSLVKKPEETPDFNGGVREPTPDPQKPEDAHNKDILALMGIKPSNT